MHKILYKKGKKILTLLRIFSRTLYVRHLDNNICEEELKTRYGKFGHILVDDG